MCSVYLLPVYNFLTLIVIFFMVGTNFADKYSSYVAVFYWLTLILGSIFLSWKHSEEWFVFPVASVFLLVVIALTSG